MNILLKGLIDNLEDLKNRIGTKNRIDYLTLVLAIQVIKQLKERESNEF